MKNEIGRGRTMGQYLVVCMKGFCMGAADVVPGVSGGTMAFILGIYEELIGSIKSVDLEFLKKVFRGDFAGAIDHCGCKFLLAVASGIFLAIFSIARLLGWLLENQPVFLWSFFFGLVLASVLTVGKEIRGWSVSIAGWLIFGAVGAFYIVGIVPMQTPETAWFLFLSGALAICAMILPGISGAFILVLLGKYAYVLEAVNNRDFLTLGLVAMGAVVGLITFVRILHWLFNRYHRVTMAVLAGLMLGSLRKIWPWKENLEGLSDGHGGAAATVMANMIPDRIDSEVIFAVVLMLAGVATVMSLECFAQGKKAA